LAIGLGHKPNVVPPTTAEFNSERRPVEVGWHPVAGAAGKWFAEETVIGKFITDKINKYPDPTQHWAVLVGDYVHQLWMVIARCIHQAGRTQVTDAAVQDENLDVIYTNEKFKREEWCTFPVGNTSFNDEAMRQAGEWGLYSVHIRQLIAAAA
jgi:hypothetical protein